LNPGKECGFEEDINIPLIVRGPGVPVRESNVVTAHTDLAPTVLKIVGGKWGWDGLDGTPIPLNEKDFDDAKEHRQEHVNVEFWGRGIPEGTHKFSLDDGKIGAAPLEFSFGNTILIQKHSVDYGANNTYKALRVIGNNYNLYYSVWCTNEHELYDLTVRIATLLLHISILTAFRLILVN
jgi:hypothetical protein